MNQVVQSSKMESWCMVSQEACATFSNFHVYYLLKQQIKREFKGWYWIKDSTRSENRTMEIEAKFALEIFSNSLRVGKWA